MAIAMSLAATLTACGSSDQAAEKKRKTESLTDYATSTEGRRALALSQSRAAARNPQQARPSLTDATTRSIEGSWKSPPTTKGDRIRVSFSRDGLMTMEQVDRTGSSSNYAQGNLNVRGAGVSGSLTNPRKDLIAFRKWKLLNTGNSRWIMIGDKKTLPLSR